MTIKNQRRSARLQQVITQGKSVLSRLKPYLRWIILGGTLFFLASALRQHWTEVVALEVDLSGWSILAAALGVTLLAHVWAGWVWSWILRELNQPAQGTWGVSIYLKTNIAKYLPGNVWHLYGRIVAAKTAGFPVGAATLSVLLEPLLMAAAALAIALVSLQSGHWWLQALSLTLVLSAIHPRILNPLLRIVGRLKGKPKQVDIPPNDQAIELSPTTSSLPPDSPPPLPYLKRYPWLPLSGELLFVLLRGTGFLLTVLALSSIDLAQLPTIFSAFSFAWLLGLIIPGAPGGLGVFEATVLALLDGELPSAVILGSIALYRLISTLAEAGGAGLAYLNRR